MIESAIPEIDVEQLMHRVRLEAAKLRSAGGRSSDALSRPRASTLPPLRVLPPPPRLPVLKMVDAKQERFERLLREAQAKSDGNPRVPKVFRRFFRKQGGYNRLLIDSVALLAKTTAQLAKRLGELTASIEPQSRWLRALAEFRQSDTTWMRAASQEIVALREEIGELRSQLESLRSDLDARRADDGAPRSAGVAPAHVSE